MKVGKVPEEKKDPLIDSDGEDAKRPIASKHPSKNYRKDDLYDRWVKARTNATNYKLQVTELQKEAVKDKKELEKLYGELSKEKETVDDLQDRIDDLLLEVKEKNQNCKNDGAKKPTVSDTERIQNMRATYQSLRVKEEYQHKTVLCELQLKYDELALNLKAKEEEVSRLKEQIKFFKKDHCDIKELKVASLKSEIQISSMRDKNTVR